MPQEPTDVLADETEADDPPQATPSRGARPSPRRILVVGTLVALILALGVGALAAVVLDDDEPARLGDGPIQAELVPIDDEILGLPVAQPFLTFDGETANTADYLGTPLVVNFFAEWCAPCVAEMPDFETVNQERAGEVAFLGISTQESPDDGRSLIERTGITYDVGRDPDGEMFAAFTGTGMPTTALIDPSGTVVGVHSGALTAQELRDWLDDAFG